MVQRAVEGAYKQSGHRAVTCSQTNKNREEASKQGASSRFVSGRLPRAGNLPKGFRASAGDWTAPSSALPSGAKQPKEANDQQTAGRTPARGSAVQRPTQRIATADAARCDGQCSALRWPMQRAAAANMRKWFLSVRLPSWARKRTSHCPEPSFPDKNSRFHRSQNTFSPFHQSQLTSTYTFLASVTEIVLTGERKVSPSWLVASKVYCKVPSAGTWK